MTEEQKTCTYCHDFKEHDEYTPDLLHGGEDFGDGETYFKVYASAGFHYIGVVHNEGERSFDADSEAINFCPMCGRKLGKDGQA